MLVTKKGSKYLLVVLNDDMNFIEKLTMLLGEFYPGLLIDLLCTKAVDGNQLRQQLQQELEEARLIDTVEGVIVFMDDQYGGSISPREGRRISEQFREDQLNLNGSPIPSLVLATTNRYEDYTSWRNDPYAYGDAHVAQFTDPNLAYYNPYTAIIGVIGKLEKGEIGDVQAEIRGSDRTNV